MPEKVGDNVWPMYQGASGVHLVPDLDDTKEPTMSSARQTEKMAPMTPSPLQARIDALDLHRQELGVTVERLCARAGLTAQSWRDMRNGKRGEKTVEKFERALAWIEEHADDQLADDSTTAQSPSPSSLMEFEVTGDFGVRVVVRGPVGNAEELERAAAQIIRDIRGSQGSSEA